MSGFIVYRLQCVINRVPFTECNGHSAMYRVIPFGFGVGNISQTDWNYEILGHFWMIQISDKKPIRYPPPRTDTQKSTENKSTSLLTDWSLIDVLTEWTSESMTSDSNQNGIRLKSKETFRDNVSSIWTSTSFTIKQSEWKKLVSNQTLNDRAGRLEWWSNVNGNRLSFEFSLVSEPENVWNKSNGTKSSNFETKFGTKFEDKLSKNQKYKSFNDTDLRSNGATKSTTKHWKSMKSVFCSFFRVQISSKIKISKIWRIL